MNFILIGNYPRDGQKSMDRFADMLAGALRDIGHDVAIWTPPVVFGSWGKSAHEGLGKWLGYVDKWILAAVLFWLRQWGIRIQKREFRFHVCDHSNSPYLSLFPSAKSGITCHDVLAIRGALGDESVSCPASPAGVYLQRWILKNLLSARKLAAVSEATLKDFEGLERNSSGKTRDVGTARRRKVIYNAFNGAFAQLSREETKEQIQQVGLAASEPFLLHVGSDLPRKNREMLVRMAEVEWSGKVVFAGKAPGSTLKQVIESSAIRDRIVVVENPDHRLLVALYCNCYAFVFPSFSEGFGWPLIEAQACGVPVIASSRPPMPEVSGGGALHADPEDVDSFSEALRCLREESLRKELIKNGLENVSRFSNESMGQAYEALHS